jgi:hypothetical protein
MVSKKPFRQSVYTSTHLPMCTQSLGQIRTCCWAQLSMTYNLEFKHCRYRYECDNTLNIPGASRRQMPRHWCPKGTTTLRSVCRNGQDQIVSSLFVGFMGAADRQKQQSLPQNLSINGQQDTRVERLKSLTFYALERQRLQLRECLSPLTLDHGSADAACTPAQQCLIPDGCSVGHIPVPTTSTLGCSVINRMC